MSTMHQRNAPVRDALLLILRQHNGDAGMTTVEIATMGQPQSSRYLCKMPHTDVGKLQHTAARVTELKDGNARTEMR